MLDYFMDRLLIRTASLSCLPTEAVTDWHFRSGTRDWPVMNAADRRQDESSGHVRVVAHTLDDVEIRQLARGYSTTDSGGKCPFSAGRSCELGRNGSPSTVAKWRINSSHRTGNAC